MGVAELRGSSSRLLGGFNIGLVNLERVCTLRVFPSCDLRHRPGAIRRYAAGAFVSGSHQPVISPKHLEFHLLSGHRLTTRWEPIVRSCGKRNTTHAEHPHRLRGAHAQGLRPRSLALFGRTASEPKPWTLITALYTHRRNVSR